MSTNHIARNCQLLSEANDSRNIYTSFEFVKLKSDFFKLNMLLQVNALNCYGFSREKKRIFHFMEKTLNGIAFRKTLDRLTLSKNREVFDVYIQYMV